VLNLFRVDEDSELNGLDTAELGEPAYHIGKLNILPCNIVVLACAVTFNHIEKSCSGTRRNEKDHANLLLQEWGGGGVEACSNSSILAGSSLFALLPCVQIVKLY